LRSPIDRSPNKHVYIRMRNNGASLKEVQQRAEELGELFSLSALSQFFRRNMSRSMPRTYERRAAEEDEDIQISAMKLAIDEVSWKEPMFADVLQKLLETYKKYLKVLREDPDLTYKACFEEYIRPLIKKQRQ